MASSCSWLPTALENDAGGIRLHGLVVAFLLIGALLLDAGLRRRARGMGR